MKAKGNKFSSKAAKPVRGGSGHMVGKQHAGQQAPGQTATKSGAGGKFAKGGSGKMFGYQGSYHCKPL